jgi:hypothetical protein
MNSHKWTKLGLVVAVTFFLAACSKQSSVDTAPVENAFKSADSTVKSSADKVVAAVKSADYAGALVELKSLAGKARLTPEQQQSLKDLMSQVEKAVTDAASKAVDDVKKSLPK